MRVRCPIHDEIEDACVDLLRLGMTPAAVALATKTTDDGAAAKLAATRDAVRMEARS
jgi:hypothetical protein